MSLSDAYNLVSPEPTGSGAFRSMKAALDDAGLHDMDQTDVHEVFHFEAVFSAFTEINNPLLFVTPDPPLTHTDSSAVYPPLCPSVVTIVFCIFSLISATPLSSVCILAFLKVGHINCHATSTPLGDMIELAAIAQLLEHY
ncbi:unnamed protein product, partial [Dibothriocephalus latus]